MSPEVYMCYLISVKHGNFKKLVVKWNREFKTYHGTVEFRTVKAGMQEIRKNKSGDNWNNFNVEQLLSFINDHLYWDKQ